MCVKSVKVLEENIGRKSQIFHTAIFSLICPLEQGTDRKEKQRDFIKTKSFFMAKENISKMKREWNIWENISANDTLDKGLISKICKELTQLHSKKTNNTIKEWAKDLNRHFFKEDIQRVQGHMKGCSSSLAIRET